MRCFFLHCRAVCRVQRIARSSRGNFRGQRQARIKFRIQHARIPPVCKQGTVGLKALRAFQKTTRDWARRLQSQLPIFEIGQLSPDQWTNFQQKSADSLGRSPQKMAAPVFKQFLTRKRIMHASVCAFLRSDRWVG